MAAVKRSNQAFNLETCARPNIVALQPYRCARDDYKDDGTNILLDANENAYGPSLAIDHVGHLAGPGTNGTTTSNGASQPSISIDFLGLNRYPDPHQYELKSLLCSLRNTHHHTPLSLTPSNLFLGVGSDEAIDALLRCFCRPGIDKILTCPPTYGMYAVSAQVNDVAIVSVPLSTPCFSVQPTPIIEALHADPSIKLIYVTSPGNPTANLVSKAALAEILSTDWNGLVVIDEAYIDFAVDEDSASLANWVLEWPNLVVLQTLSKAFGLAGIRLGVAFASEGVARLLNNLKAPYNISSPTSALAKAALQPENLALMRKYRALIQAQRARLLGELPKVPGVGKFLGGRDANFLLVEVLSGPGAEGVPDNEVALRVYEQLAEDSGVVVRFRGKEHGCTGCLRITVGTEEEVTRFLREIRLVLERVYGERAGIAVEGTARKRVKIDGLEGGTEEEREREANGVIA